MEIRFTNVGSQLCRSVGTKIEFFAAVEAAWSAKLPGADRIGCQIRVPQSIGGGWAPVSGLEHLPRSYWGARARLAEDWNALCLAHSLVSDVSRVVVDAAVNFDGVAAAAGSARILVFRRPQNILF